MFLTDAPDEILEVLGRSGGLKDLPMQVLVCHGDVREVLANEDLDVRVVKTKSDETAQPVVVRRKLTVHTARYRPE